MNRAATAALLFVLAAGPLATEALARAGGGRNGGGGGILTLILMPFFIAYAWWKNKKIKEKNLAAESLLIDLAKRDPIWEETRVVGAARKIFLAVQEAWCNQDLPALRDLLEPGIYGEWERNVMELQSKGWTNKMEGLKIGNVRVVEVKNFKDDAKDSFSARVAAAAADYTVDRSGAIVESNSGDDKKRDAKQKSFEGFTEYWTFVRRGDGWKLERVDEDGDWDKTVSAPLVNEDASPS